MKLPIKMKLPIEMTEAEFVELSNDNMGVCLACGEQRDCCEPDARGYECDVCEMRMVMGLEQTLIEGYIVFVSRSADEEVKI